jgi:hypothetical protein
LDFLKQQQNAKIIKQNNTPRQLKKTMKNSGLKEEDAGEGPGINV